MTKLTYKISFSNGKSALVQTSRWDLAEAKGKKLTKTSKFLNTTITNITVLKFR